VDQELRDLRTELEADQEVQAAMYPSAARCLLRRVRFFTRLMFLALVADAR
jgi:hypothetical protein